MKSCQVKTPAVQQHEQEWPLVLEWAHQQLRPCTPRHPNKYVAVKLIYANTQGNLSNPHVNK